MTGWGWRVFGQKSRRWTGEVRWRPWGMLGKAETYIQGQETRARRCRRRNIHRGARGTYRAICYMETHTNTNRGKKRVYGTIIPKGLKAKCEAPLIFQVVMHNILLLNNIRDIFNKIFKGRFKGSPLHSQRLHLFILFYTAKQKYCEILLEFKITFFCCNIKVLFLYPL